MDRVVIVGSGASGVHFALSLLRKGYPVTMLDVGNQKSGTVHPQNNWTELKSSLNDPVEYFLGNDFEAVIFPKNESEYYGFPPNKNYVFKKPTLFNFRASGFAPLFSFAQGGLAEVWTGGVYPLNDEELCDFPFSFAEIAPYYNEVTNRIGISGARDDLARFLPFHDHIVEPLRLDDHSDLLLSRYARKKTYLNKRLNCFMGRSRIAVLSCSNNGRKACTYSGRCLWGCPSGALYSPSLTLEECRKHKNFDYIRNMYVCHFSYNSKRRITAVIARSTLNGQSQEFSLDRLALAAGTLCTSTIFLRSIFANSGETVKLHGLMDNRQILVPFINLRMIGKPYTAESYQYHLLALGFESAKSEEYVHGQITTLKSALIHPIIQSIPLDIKTSTFIFRNLHSALGLINLNFFDRRREGNYVTLVLDSKLSEPSIYIHYEPVAGEFRCLKKTLKKIKKAMRALECIIPPGMVHIRPMGSSVHYSGTIPMTSDHGTFTTSEFCRSNDFQNLFIVDGTTFPFLPAKNLTFTLMANAVRIADTAF